MAILTLTIPGDPIPKGRPRTGKNGHHFTPDRTRLAEQAIVDLVRQELGDQPPVDVPVGIAAEFYCATRRRTDGDNLLKLVTDAMNKLVFTDDSLILEWFCRVKRGVGKDQAHSEIMVWQLE